MDCGTPRLPESSPKDPTTASSARMDKDKARRPDNRGASPDPAWDPGYLSRLLGSADLDVLHHGVQVGLHLLDQLEKAQDFVKQVNRVEAEHWLKTIKDLRARAQPPSVLIGVVGNTGSGKSSVINALLDEERLLPTNCMRACTAAPTEISYNDSQEPNSPYRADIEFFSFGEWATEIRTLFFDIQDGNGLTSRELATSDGAAGAAYARLKAVYPTLTADTLRTSSPEELLRDESVSQILGTVKRLKATTSAQLYDTLQGYVDSKEKNSGGQMEVWPLIKVVRIYTKAPVLSSGLVIVDLPGVQDSNAARSAVAANYMKNCDGIFIVAPITRAVDDKTAKTLLGSSFKRQLMFDGQYSAITLICSKTDEISVVEAAESLPIKDQIVFFWGVLENMDRQAKEYAERLDVLKSEKSALKARLDAIREELLEWNGVCLQFAEEGAAYSPSKKRKRQPSPAPRRENSPSSDTDESASETEVELSDEDMDCSTPDEEQNAQPLTKDDIKDKINELKAAEDLEKKNKRTIDRQFSEAKAQLKAIKTARNKLNYKIHATCIQGRNKYSQDAIRRDFAAGLKELECGDGEPDGASDQASRRYDEIARSLPVFCVSSRAFQKLRNRMRKDGFKGDGFRDLQETGIPQLVQHAQEIPRPKRAQAFHSFLNGLVQLLNSMYMWADDDGQRPCLTGKEKAVEEACIQKCIADLDKALQDHSRQLVRFMKTVLSEQIFAHLDDNIDSASAAAVPTATKWGGPKPEGGLAWNTYKATGRRSGAFLGRDFNRDLLEPLVQHLATLWEQVFQHRIPGELGESKRKVKIEIQRFHTDATCRTRSLETDPVRLYMLDKQIGNYRRTVNQIFTDVEASIREDHMNANRCFVPVIQQRMSAAYSACVEETGTGAYARMKTIMLEHIEDARHHMFEDASNAVKDMLDEMCDRVEKTLLERFHELWDQCVRDYTTALIGAAPVAPNEMALRKQILSLMANSDMAFKDVLPAEDSAADTAMAVDEAQKDVFASDDEGDNRMDLT
ncbi:hypothetical protein VTK73DRAFT_6744 [Phialemonium thermophilum]|uniref:Uncharacterized protein n=1 Tax=Phialemonium thermophilum TaxID=223376 RepID=A0ABR3WID0_9PEZI